jgi:crotonobetainyl-CoA:carnitine CoA-transferase CaiB-like acyl-CoA transferase
MTLRHSPLAGICVIDFGHYIAGPLTGMLLADQGAEVIKVDRPNASGAPTPLAAVLNRGKRRLVLDLKTQSGRDTAVELIEAADVIIENFRPGVMNRLGLGAETMTTRNPRLIYLSLPGFASDVSPISQLPAWEGIIGAACGLYTDVNLLREFLGLPPNFSALPYGSVHGAVHGALAITTALIARETSGIGEIVEVPLVSAAMSAMGSSVLHFASQPRRYDLPSIPRLLRRTLMPLLRLTLAHASSQWRERAYQVVRGITPALMSSYVCSDNRLLHIFATDHRRHARDLLARLGLLHEMEREGLRDHNPYEAGGGRNNLSEGSGLPGRRQRQLRASIAARFREKPAGVWESELGAAGVPCSMQRMTAEWLALEALRVSGILVDIDDPNYGRMRQPGPHCWLRAETESAGSLRPVRTMSVQELETFTRDRLRPHPDDHGLAAAGMKTPAAKSKSVLDGTLVLDLSTMIAGPVCARTLAEYGADVIKIESPHPMHGPRMVCWFGADVDQGKRNLLLDVATKDGQGILRQLIERAGVLVHNFSRSAVTRLGLKMEDLARINPRLVLCRLSAFEGPEPGPWDERKAYDPVLQAASGIMVRYGSADQPEYHGLASCIDYVTGYCSALGAVLALYKRRRDPNGIGCEAVTSLAQGANLAQTPFAFDFPGWTRNEPSGQRCRGDDVLHRLYRARDGWLFLAARPDKRGAILATSELNPRGLAIADESNLARFLERRLRAKDVAYWQHVFRPLDVGIFPVRTLQQIRRATVERRPGARCVVGGPSIQVIRQAHPVGCEVDTLAPAYARLKRHPLRYLDPAPKPGSHTLEIIDELGIAKQEQRNLLKNGTIALQLSESYLPP